MEQEAAQKAAVVIADAIGENGGPGQAPRARVEAQITRMILLMGKAWVDRIVRHARALLDGKKSEGAEWLSTKDGKVRTLGAVFFAWARNRGRAAVVFNGIPSETGERLSPKDFYRTFCWYEPTPKLPRAPRPPKAKKPKPARPAPQPTRLYDRRATPLQEVEVIRVRPR